MSLAASEKGIRLLNKNIQNLNLVWHDLIKGTRIVRLDCPEGDTIGLVKSSTSILYFTSDFFCSEFYINDKIVIRLI
jgi:hypothetical protein